MRPSFAFLVTAGVVFSHPIRRWQMQPVYSLQNETILGLSSSQAEALPLSELQIVGKETSDPTYISVEKNAGDASRRSNTQPKPEPHKPYNDLAGTLARVKAQNQAIKDKQENHEEMKKAAKEYNRAKKLDEAGKWPESRQITNYNGKKVDP